MAKAKLSKRRIEALNADGERERWLWDSDIPGLAVRVKPSGIKAFVVQYRNARRRARKITLGRFPVLTADEARQRARRILAAVERGEDPAEERRARLDALTVADLGRRYLAEHVDVHNKPTTQARVHRLVTSRINPALGDIPIEAVGRADVARLHARLRRVPYEANRVVATLSKMFNLAELWELRPDGSNPCRHLQRYREHPRRRFFREGELQRLGAALAVAEREGREPAAALLFIRLLALTGCRFSEILDLRWQDIDLERGVIWLPDAKAGARPVPLAAPALALLAAAARRAAAGPLLIDEASGAPLTASRARAVWKRLCRRAELEGVRLHDLRHTVGTYAAEAGLNAFVVRDLLGHKTLAMTGRYVERHTDPLRTAATQVATRIATALGTDDTGMWGDGD